MVVSRFVMWFVGSLGCVDGGLVCFLLFLVCVVCLWFVAVDFLRVLVRSGGVVVVFM